MAAISVQGLCKQFTLGALKHSTLRDQIAAFFQKGSRGRAESFWALSDLSFAIQQGEVVGVIGRNGAGKSTLLKILSQITEPTKGEVRIRGRVASLLEVGTGFHTELTGRENVYLNGAILGMSRGEINRKFDEIVAFSEVERFLDMPVKHYSSGMTMRLAFAVAAHLEPEVLIVDEVLAVGDAVFQKKCLGKMQDVAGQGRTVLFVSHNMGAVRNLCTRGLVLEKGTLAMDGTSHDAVDYYLHRLTEKSLNRKTFSEEADQLISILSVAIICPDKNSGEPFDISDQLVAEIHYRVREDLTHTNMGIAVVREGVFVFKSFDSDLNPAVLQMRAAGDYVARVNLPRKLLVAGCYTLEATAGRPSIGFITKQPCSISFELGETSEDMTHKSYAAKRGALIIMPLPWEQQTAIMKDNL